MLRLELLELIGNGEGSGTEFKRDDLTPQDLAQAMVAFANLRGGLILLGVEDDGSISGILRREADEWVLAAARDKVRPPLIPYVERVHDAEAGRDVLVVTVDPGYAVHARVHNNSLTYYIRVGRQSREASPEELGRLQQQRGDVRAELRPVGGAGLDRLDRRRLVEYFATIRSQPIPTNEDGWTRLLLATELAVHGLAGPVCSVAGTLLFSPDVARLLPHGGLDAVAYPGVEKDYAARERATLRGPLVALRGEDGVVERGVVEKAVDFVVRNSVVTAQLQGGPAGSSDPRTRQMSCEKWWSTPLFTVTIC